MLWIWMWIWIKRKGKRREMEELNLEYKILGEGKNVIVIETGIGSSFYDWYSFVQELKEDFTVVLYHRSSYGKSQTSNSQRTTRNIAEELNCLVDKIGLKESFILMGHSFGGLCVQQYAKMYPHRLKAVVLVDSTSYNFQQLYTLDLPTMNSDIAVDKMVEFMENLSKKTKEELRHENENIISAYRRKYMSDSEMKDVEDFFTNTRLYKTMAEEFSNWYGDSEDIKSIGDFPNVPLIVIARDNKVSEDCWVKNNFPRTEAELYEAEWRKLQIELSKLSEQGRLIIAEDSDHEIYIDRPDVIIECLKSLV